MVIDLSWPPSVNHYWRHTKNGHYVSLKGQAYRKEVFFLTANHRNRISNSARLSVHIEAFPPDKRKRDLDNLFKSVLDSLASARVYGDDSQIDRLSIERKTPLQGRLIVHIDIL